MASVIVDVDLGDRSYDVVIAPSLDGLGPAIASSVGATRCVLCTDDTVGPLWAAAATDSLTGAGVAVERLTVPAGEVHKTRDTWWSLVDGLIGLGVDRRTPVVALGGGVLGDLAGFAAASTLRGLPFVQVPTTLLAMVDSSVGGKTGFNHPRGKNLVGAFHQPRLVWAALDTLTTLDPRERRAGLGEVMKTALLGDAALWSRLTHEAAALGEGTSEVLAEVVAACVRTKAAVVAEDEREAGRRAVLNAGHTVGHALETVVGYGTLRHGEAVGLGLVAETAWGVSEGLTEDAQLPRAIAAVLDAAGLPVRAPSADRAALVRAAEMDKKARGDTLTLPVVVRPGRCALVSLPRTRLPELVAELP